MALDLSQDLAVAEHAPATLPSSRSAARQTAYRLFGLVNRLLPKQDAVVVHSTIDLEDGVLAVLEELHRRGIGATVLLEDPEKAAAVRAVAPDGTSTVKKRSAQGVWRFLTARHVFTTETVFGDRQPPANQVLVNLWHGEPPTKVVARFSGQPGIACTWAPVCSTLGRAYRAAEFDLAPRQVPVLGAPRNDRMLRADAAALRRDLLGDEAALPTLLWLPSLRAGRWGQRERSDVVGNSYPGLPFAPEDVRRLDDWLVANEVRLVVKLHPHDVASFPDDHRAIRVLAQRDMEDRGMTIYPVLSAFDGLVTDVSSVWIDYLLLDKPLIFAFPDVEEYRQGRGLNLEPYEEWVPGPFVRTIDGLVRALADVATGTDASAAARGLARRRFHAHVDAASASRLLDHLGLGEQDRAAPPIGSAGSASRPL